MRENQTTYYCVLVHYLQEEYVQKSNPLFAPSTFTDELKKEVPFLKLVCGFFLFCLPMDLLPSNFTLPFVFINVKSVKHAIQELCLKLDALSHFHFTPKPVCFFFV